MKGCYVTPAEYTTTAYTFSSQRGNGPCGSPPPMTSNPRPLPGCSVLPPLLTEAERRARDARRQDAAALLAYRPGGLARRTGVKPSGVHSLDLPPLWRVCRVSTGRAGKTPPTAESWLTGTPIM
jgi:hypothetical protein